MPLNTKGQKIKAKMKKTYGAKKGEQVFYASENKGTIKGVKKHTSSKTASLDNVSAVRNTSHRAQMEAKAAKGLKAAFPE
jgi:hypothetical protein